MTTENQLGNFRPDCFCCYRIFMLLVTMQIMFFFFLFVAVPEPVTFYPLNARYKAAEKENRQPDGILGDVAITNGPYNEPGGAYMFYGNFRSYIEFPNKGGLDIRFSITLMCWVQPGGRDGPLFNYGDILYYGWGPHYGVDMGIVKGKFFIRINYRESWGQHRIRIRIIRSPKVLPVGKWVHVAASYDHGNGSNSLYINGHLRASYNIGRGYQIATNTQKVRMGSRTGRDGNFKGKIAEMKVYDVALNEAQIQTSIRQGSCAFPVIPYPIILLLIETPVIEQPSKIKQISVSGSYFVKQRRNQ